MKITIFWLSVDSDAPLATQVFATIEEREGARETLILQYWAQWFDNEEMPGDLNDAWDRLSERRGFVDSIQTGESELEIGFDQLRGVELGQCISHLAQSNDERATRLISRARDLHHVDGEVEIDDTAIISGANDTSAPGDYVLAWVWVGDDHVEEDQSTEFSEVQFDDRSARELSEIHGTNEIDEEAAAQDECDRAKISDPETELRALWTAQGVPAARQDELIRGVVAAAAPGAKVGPFVIPE